MNAAFQASAAAAVAGRERHGDGGGAGKPMADICVIAHVDDPTGKLIAEMPGGDRLPRSVLEQLTCNSLITPAIYDRRGVLLWQGHSKRTATTT